MKTTQAKPAKLNSNVAAERLDIPSDVYRFLPDRRRAPFVFDSAPVGR